MNVRPQGCLNGLRTEKEKHRVCNQDKVKLEKGPNWPRALFLQAPPKAPYCVSSKDSPCSLESSTDTLTPKAFFKQNSISKIIRSVLGVGFPNENLPSAQIYFYHKLCFFTDSFSVNVENVLMQIMFSALQTYFKIIQSCTPDMVIRANLCSSFV